MVKLKHFHKMYLFPPPYVKDYNSYCHAVMGVHGAILYLIKFKVFYIFAEYIYLLIKRFKKSGNTVMYGTDAIIVFVWKHIAIKYVLTHIPQMLEISGKLGIS